MINALSRRLPDYPSSHTHTHIYMNKTLLGILYFVFRIFFSCVTSFRTFVNVIATQWVWHTILFFFLHVLAHYVNVFSTCRKWNLCVRTQFFSVPECSVKITTSLPVLFPPPSGEDGNSVISVQEKRAYLYKRTVASPLIPAAGTLLVISVFRPEVR